MSAAQGPERVGTGFELIQADLDAVKKVFNLLNNVDIEHISNIKIVFSLDGGDTITVGYGEQCEPAILNVEPAQ